MKFIKAGGGPCDAFVNTTNTEVGVVVHICTLSYRFVTIMEKLRQEDCCEFRTNLESQDSNSENSETKQ